MFIWLSISCETVEIAYRNFFALDVDFVRKVCISWRHLPRVNRERKKIEREAYSESEKRSADMERCRSADVSVMI